MNMKVDSASVNYSRVYEDSTRRLLIKRINQLIKQRGSVITYEEDSGKLQKNGKSWRKIVSTPECLNCPKLWGNLIYLEQSAPWIATIC